MLRTANEMNAETREAIEDRVMQIIATAAANREYASTFALGDIPDWLCTKLVNYGYILTVDDEWLGVSWELARYAE